MKKSLFVFLTVLCLVSALAVTDARAFRLVTEQMIQKELVTEVDLIRTADNFIVMFDSSSSTNQMVPGTGISKIMAAKEFLKARNQYLPDLGYNAGLYNYTSFETAAGTFKEVYGMQPYNKQLFAAAINKLPDKGAGPTNMLTAMLGLQKVMKNLRGETVVFLFTDGIVQRQAGFKKPLEVAQEIDRDHDVTFYVISSATEKVNRELLKAVAQVNASSRVIPIQYFLYNPYFVGGALYTVKASSYVRLTPTTKVVGFVANDMLFDFDSATIRPEYHEKLNLLGEYMQEAPTVYVVAAGFTDNIGAEEYNIELSRQRAASVRAYLMDKYSIHESRVALMWFGDLNPVGDNSSREGRQANRRVGIAVGGLE